MAENSWNWRGIKVKHEDGRKGVVDAVDKYDDTTALTIAVTGGQSAEVQLNLDGPDTGEAGWLWFDDKAAEPNQWRPLGSF